MHRGLLGVIHVWRCVKCMKYVEVCQLYEGVH